MNIQFGSGGNRLGGWNNHDAETDISKRLPYGDGCADMVFCEHCLEHVASPAGFGFLEEAYRILKPGGVIRLCVPELARLDRAAAKDIIIGHGHLMVYCEESLTLMLKTAGFSEIRRTQRAIIDGHHRVIGIEKDDRETLRMEAVK